MIPIILPILLSLVSPSNTRLVFPGGGIYFYWQAGVVTYLRQQGYNLDHTLLRGASAGALTATLTATNVDFYHATDLALQYAYEAGVWERKGGLQGVWGPLIESWLHDLLPADAHETVDERLEILVTPVPTFGKNIIESFHSKDDLVRCNMASVHIPWFLDSKLLTDFRDKPVIDGSFLAKKRDYIPEDHANVIVIDHSRDPVYRDQNILSFVETLKPDGIYKLLEDGKKYAKTMEECGKFEKLQIQEISS